MNIYERIPINKTAGLVTSQKGCIDNIFISMRQEKRILGLRKELLKNKIRDLKKTIGFTKNYSNLNMPKFIIKHNKYITYKKYKEEYIKIEARIIELKCKLKDMDFITFERRFIDLTKELYPDIYKKIKCKIFKEVDE